MGIGAAETAATTNDRRIGFAVASFLALFAVVATVWAIDDHFITRREFNEAVRQLRAEMYRANNKPVPYELREPKAER